MMQPDELASLRTQADEIHARDIHLGRLLHGLIDHIVRLDEAGKQDTSPRLKAVTKEDKTNGD